MLDIHSKPKQTSPVSKEPITGVSAEIRQSWHRRLWGMAKIYPHPFASITLMIASLTLWLARYGTLANWLLLAVVLLGGIPLLWETGKQILHKEFSVDVIAILAIAGSLLLGQYLAGALVVLMLSGGEA